MTDNSTIDSDGASPDADRVDQPPVVVPEWVNVNAFQKRSLIDLHQIAQELGLRVAGVRSKHQLVFEILKFYGSRGTVMEAEGFLDYSGDSFGFLRWPDFSFASNADDVYLAVTFVKKYDLRSGQKLKCLLRGPREREKFLSVETILEVEGIPAEEWKSPPLFDNLTAMFPSKRLIMESSATQSPSPRVIDLVAPLGKGQRGLIVAPPRGGKTILLKSIAVSIHENNPEVELIVLLLDERPEEVTDFRETVAASVYSSTFDESANRHIEVADMVLNRAKRLVENGKDVVSSSIVLPGSPGRITQPGSQGAVVTKVAGTVVVIAAEVGVITGVAAVVVVVVVVVVAVLSGVAASRPKLWNGRAGFSGRREMWMKAAVLPFWRPA